MITVTWNIIVDCTDVKGGVEMRRSEFDETDIGWSDAIDIAYAEGWDGFDEIYSDEARDESINESLSADVDDFNWTEIRDFLNNIPGGYDLYRRDNVYEWVGLGDDDLECYVEEFLSWMDDYDRWEPEDDEDDADDEQFESDVDPDEPDIEQEDFTVAELFVACTIEKIEPLIKTIDELRDVHEESDFEELVAF